MTSLPDTTGRANVQPNLPAIGEPDSTGGLKRGAMLTLVAVYAACVFLTFLGDGRLLTRHEVMQAQPALTILEDGEWLVPKLLGEPWVHKPPLAIWMTAAMFAVFGGFSETVARLPAALSAVALCLLVALLADRYYGRRAGLLAGLAQATCVYMFMQGRLGEVDMPFALFIAAAHVVLAWQWAAGNFPLSIRAASLFHTAAGLAILTKGPLAIILIGFPILLFAAVERSWLPIRRVLWTPAIVLSAVIGFGWYLAVILSVGDEAVGRWNASYLERFLGHYHLDSHGPLFYFYTVPWLVLPWTVGIVIGAKLLWRDARDVGGRLDRYLWCWFLAGFAFLTIASFRSKHYAVPILPPLSLFAGKLADIHIRRVGRQAKHFYLIGFGITLCIFLIIGGYVMPARDWRKPTVAFLDRELDRVPAGATLYVAGLAQSAVYPYIERDFDYINSFSDARMAAENDEAGQPWLLTQRRYLTEAVSRGYVVREVAAEAPRDRVPHRETLVLARMIAAPDAPPARR